MRSVRQPPKTVKALNAELAAAQSELSTRDHQLRLLREAVKTLRSQRDAAEIDRARATMKLRSWRDTMLGALVVRLEGVSRRFPRVSAYVSYGIGLLGAALTLKVRDYREKRRVSRAILNEDRALILASGLFDERYYLTQNPDIDLSAQSFDALDHYLIHGAQEGRNPNSGFDSFWYLATYPEVEVSRRNPLAHYVHSGAAMDYAPNPAFDVRWYRAVHASELQGGVLPLQHFNARPAYAKPATEPSLSILRETETR